MIYCFAHQGFEGELVKLEVELRRAIPGMDLIGLPDSAVKESRERVRAAIHSSGFEYPRERILVNLAPAGIKKSGARYDLAVAASVLEKSGQLPELEGSWLMLGELQLNGSVRPVTGILSAVVFAGQLGINNCIVPVENLNEAQSSGSCRCLGIQHLSELSSLQKLTFSTEKDGINSTISDYPDFKDVKGQEILKRALTVAIAGRHHSLIFGPPGCGKTFSARAMEGILPDLSNKDALDLTRIWSQAGKTTKGLLRQPFFREPHHSSSAEGILGGTSEIIPGEISLSHRGVLLLDEAPEFNNRVLQGLREPLETGSISLVRAGKSYWFPADFQLIMTANPCPCGNMGRKRNPCICSAREIEKYWKGLTGPLMDRIDIRLPIRPVETEILLGNQGVSSEEIKIQVIRARESQFLRFPEKSRPWNGSMSQRDIQKHCELDSEGSEILYKGVSQFGLSSRAIHSLLKVARTIADLEERDKIHKKHLLEAMGYRRYGENDLFWRKSTQ